MHIVLHFWIPWLVAISLCGRNWLRPWLWMLAGLLIDIDHLLATPIYDPDRCSIGFHPLHQPLPIVFYAGLLAFRKTRFVGLGLLIHIVLDSIDCRVNIGAWWT